MYSITVSPEMYTVLRQRARQARSSPDKIVDEALHAYFSHEEQTWQREFESLIAKVQARTMIFGSAEIDSLPLDSWCRIR